MSKQNISKDIRSAVKLEQEMQATYRDKGVAVLDIYSSEWGPCRAIAETFRRLLTEQPEGVHLRFFTVEVRAVLQSLASGDERNIQRPKNVEPIRDTLPDVWAPILESRVGLSKPFFVCYREGRKAAVIDGVNTPLIRHTVKDLCTVKIPAADFITNQRLLDFWGDYFDPLESDVPIDTFLRAVYTACKMPEPLVDDEKALVLEALSIRADAREKQVTADALQKWIGEDESVTIQTAMATLLPHYDARAAATIREREGIERRQAEALAKRKEEEAEAAAVEERRRESAELQRAQSELSAIDERLGPLLKSIPVPAPEVEEGSAERSQRVAVRQSAGATIATPIPALVPPEDTDSAAAAYEDALRTAGPLHEFLERHGMTLVGVNALRTEVAATYAANVSTNAKLACWLTAVDAQSMSEATRDGVPCLSALLPTPRALDSAAPQVVAALIAQGGAPEGYETVYACGPPPGEMPAMDATVCVAPLTPFAVTAPTPGEGEVLLAVNGLARSIPLATFGANVVLVPWYTSCVVTAVAKDRVELTVEGAVHEGRFDAAVAAYAERDRNAQTMFQNLSAVQNLMRERAVWQNATAPPDDHDVEAPPAADEKEEYEEEFEQPAQEAEL